MSQLDKATEAGTEAGHSAATWVEVGDGVTMLRMIEDGEPELDGIEPSPLSGEWAGESIPEMSNHYGVDLRNPDFAEAFEVAYSQAFWLEVERACRYQLADNTTEGK